MQGLWKNKISGWKKDSKRKKQSLKHLIKDKYNVIQKEIWKNEYKELEIDEYYRIEHFLICQNCEKKKCNIIYGNSIIEAWTYDNKFWWEEKNNKTKVISENGYYVENDKTKKIKILSVLEYVEPIYEISEKKEKIVYENNKIIYKNKKLNKNYFCFDKYYYYGSYKEKIEEPKNKIKILLKNYELNEDKILKYKRKNIYMLG